MRAIQLDNLLRPNRAYRAIAIFFLVFAFTDLACPWLCQEDFAGLTGQGHAQKSPEAIVSADLRSEDHQQDQDSKSGTLEEDCFCCCSHVQPSCRPIMPAISPDNSGFPLPLAGLPVPPPTGTYHPPRSASC